MSKKSNRKITFNTHLKTALLLLTFDSLFQIESMTRKEQQSVDMEGAQRAIQLVHANENTYPILYRCAQSNRKHFRVNTRDNWREPTNHFITSKI